MFLYFCNPCRKLHYVVYKFINDILNQIFYQISIDTISNISQTVNIKINLITKLKYIDLKNSWYIHILAVR